MNHLAFLLTLLICTVGCSRKSPETATQPPPPTPEVAKPEYGIAVPGKPGFVQSPYAPGSGYVDVRGFPKGTEVKDPYSSRIFLVPEAEVPIQTPPVNPAKPN